MADFDTPYRRPRRLGLSITSTLILPLALLVALVGLSVHSIRTPALADRVVDRWGPVCFFQKGVPTCVERTATSVGASSGPVTPEEMLTTLLAGPTFDESAQGIDSAVPPDTRLVSVLEDGSSVTVRLAFPDGYLVPGSAAHTRESTDQTIGDTPYAINPLAVEAIEDQVVRTLFPLGYRGFSVEAEDPSAAGVFRPLSAYLPSTIPPAKEAPNRPSQQAVPEETTASDTGLLLGPAGQPPVEVRGRPPGALSGKTIYISAGHGWQWNGYGWRTQRPPYPDASTSFIGPIIEDHNNAEVVNQYLLRYLSNAGADVWTSRERDLNAFEDIVDDNSSDAAASGVWETVSSDGHLQRYLRATTELVATAVVTWTTDPVSADGVYALYVWYPMASDRASDAHYTVHHAGGSTELTVDQRYHGHTWRYIGSFPAKAGERLAVSLSNQSATSGRTVAADAVRVGGGWFDDGDLAVNGGSVETDAPNAANKPWWETAAYYHVQRLGVDPDDYAYFNDVVARPFWARWEHADTGDDAVYVSWHTNGRNGHNTTVWGTVSYIHSFQPVAGSAALRHAIHSELINDIRAGWDPDWRDLGEASRDLGELRELWDSDAANAIPGVLLEIAYHDNVDDTNALKDPRFALLSARAVYQGIVKYYGAGLPLLPEPPIRLVVRNDGPDQIRVSWQPSPTDEYGLVGDPAESYRVYTSRDGLGWDNGRVVTGTDTTLTCSQGGERIFVRVTGVNAGGESFPTSVLAARCSPAGKAPILLVDGFDRIDRHGLVFENDPTMGINARLFPDQINSFDYVVQHGEVIPVPFDSAVNEAIAAGDVDLTAYGAVDWILGEESSVDRTFDADEQAAVGAYLSSGGALFVSGAEIGWDLETLGNGPDFYHTYLGANLADDDGATYVAEPTIEGIFAGLGFIDFRDRYDVDYPDQLSPRIGSTAALNYLGGTGGTAAIQYDAGGCRRVVYLGFPFETIAKVQRPAVMERVIDYLGAGGCLVIVPQTTITTPVSGAASNDIPEFGGMAIAANPIERVEVQISGPHGRYWDGRDWITASRWLTAVGTTVWHYPFPPTVLTGTPSITTLDQGAYSLWARAWDTDNVSDTMPAFAAFIYDTISPTTPTLLAPVHGITVTSVPSGFFWLAPSDTGSALGYDLQIDDQRLQRSVTSYRASACLSTGVHTWSVRARDAAGNRSPWTDTWTFAVDGCEVQLPVIYKEYGGAMAETN